MSDDRSLPANVPPRSGVFSLFRGGGDRYSQFDDDDSALSCSPPLHDFPEPMRLKPRKNKFHSSFDTEGISANPGPGSGQAQNVEKPKIILSTPTGKSTRISSEVFKQQFTTTRDSRRGSVDNGFSPHGDNPSSAASHTLLEKAHQISIDNKQLNSPIAILARRASDTNLFRSMAVTVPTKGDNSLVKAAENAVVAQKGKEADKSEPATQQVGIKTKLPIDTVDTSGPSVGASFSGWLFGGKKTMNVQNKDMNVIGPTSF